ncbi:hypothetical protein DFH09DRAFT_1078342 [Mycena vulgaris]|nr:hypothetical protein DFH09DRAFT_1078342 [Mycena vulgaris]
MSDACILRVQGVSGICWNPGFLEPKIPSLYAVISIDGTIFHQTPMWKQDLSPEWDDVVTMSRNIPHSPGNRLTVSSTLSFEICRENTSPGKARQLVGTAKIQIIALMDLMELADVAVLELHSSTQTPPSIVGTVSVQLTVGKALSAARHFINVLGKIMANLDNIIRIPDVTTQVRDPPERRFVVMTSFQMHLYATTARHVLAASQEAAASKQCEITHKLLQLVDAMASVYSDGDVLKPISPKYEPMCTIMVDTLKQTVECALFIGDRTGSGFSPHSHFFTVWPDADEKIDDMCLALKNLRSSFNTVATTKTVFVSTATFKAEDVYTLGEKLSFPA